MFAHLWSQYCVCVANYTEYAEYKQIDIYYIM